MMFTFWEGKMPDYIRLCMDTWREPYIVLNYRNLHHYTDLPIDKLKRFTLPQIADCVRVHVLRDQGGWWMDADTIMVTSGLPYTDMVGNPETREQTIGLLHTEKGSDMYREWSAYQDKIIEGDETPMLWSVMGNLFTDEYVREHPEVRIHTVRDYWPEVYMIQEDIPRHKKYKKFYFKQNHHLFDLEPTSLLMLHNSWTPQWYKDMSAKDVLSMDCTLSNILREV